MRAFGCAALTLAYLAAGHVDIYTIEYLKPWDIAAGALIIKEAGGVIRGVDGLEYEVMKPDIPQPSTISRLHKCGRHCLRLDRENMARQASG